MDLHSDFENYGFLGTGVGSSVELLRAENSAWFDLAGDANAALMRVAASATAIAKTNSLDPKTVSVRVLLRSCEMFQGVILLAERGMVAEGRTLARSVLEGAFAIAALLTNPTGFMEMLEQDNQASRLHQAKFIKAQNLIAAGATRDKLQEVIDSIGKADFMSPKKVAALGPLVSLYLEYQRLSDDSVHVSARSLHRHVNRNGEGWCYKLGPATQDEIASTLHWAISGVVAIGVGITELLEDKVGNAEFGDLASRFESMPPVSLV